MEKKGSALTTLSSKSNGGPSDRLLKPNEEFTDFTIYKNMACLTLAFVINFSASDALQSLQSSINSKDSIGTASLSVKYGASVLSCLILPTFIIKKFGCKWTIAVSILGYSSAIAANFNPTWATMLPTSFLAGASSGPLWSAKCVYVTYIAKLYAEVQVRIEYYYKSKVAVNSFLYPAHHNKPVDATVNSFFGVFFAVYQTHSMWGNFLSTKFLQPHGNDSAKAYSDMRLPYCGADYCNEDLDALDNFSFNSSGNINKDITVPPHMTHEQLNILLGIYLAMSLFSCLLVITVLNHLPSSSSQGSESKASFKLLVVATFRLLRHKTLPLLIPLAVFRGLHEAFYVAEITKAFVTCPIGVENVGLITICFGAVASVFALVYGFLIKLITRVPVFLFAGAANFAAIATMLAVHPSPDKIWIIYSMVALWGLGDACWVSQVSALFGILFPNDLEAAFASSRLSESIGYIMAYSWSSAICMTAKLWIVCGLLCTAMLGYLAVELVTYIANRRNISENPDNSIVIANNCVKDIKNDAV